MISSALAVKPLLIVVAVSWTLLAGTGLLLRSAYKDAAVASERAETATESARMCSRGVQAIKDSQEAKNKSAEKAIKAARTDADKLRQRADQVLAAPPAGTKDCEAAQVVVNEWLANMIKSAKTQ